MKSKNVRVGNSPAIPVPQPLLDACNLHNEVEVEAQGHCLIIRSTGGPREGWDEAFSKSAEPTKEPLILHDLPPSRWDHEEWK